MPTADKKISILLAGGVDNRSLDELVAPVLSPGAAPALKRSENTRLSVRPGGVVRAPLFTTVQTLAAGVKVAGAMSSATGKRSIFCCLPNTSAIYQRVLADAGRKSIGTAYLSDNGRAAYALPCQVVESSPIADRSGTQHALSYNTTSTELWTVWIERVSGASYLTAHVESTDGIRLSQTSAVAVTSPATFVPWVGLTSHGANGNRAWYVNSAGAVCYRSLSIVNNTISFGAEVSIATPGSATAGIAVCRIGDGGAALVSSDTTAADGVTRLVDINTGGIYGQAIAVNALLGGGTCAVASTTLAGGARIASAFSSVTAGTATARLYSDFLVPISTSAAMTCTARCTVTFEQGGSAEFVVMAAEHTDPTPLRPALTISAFAVATGTLHASSYAIGFALGGHAGSWSTHATHREAIVPVVPRWGTTSTAPGGANFVDDPAIELWRKVALGSSSVVIARFGVVRGTLSPAEVDWQTHLSSSAFLVLGDDLHCAYRVQDSYDSTTDRTGRKTVVRIGSANRLPVTHDRDGCSFIAGALPLQWEGKSLAELGGPLHAPKLLATVAGGAPILAAGTHSYMVVATWRDASGLLHRSKPSAIASGVTDGATQRVNLAAKDQDLLLQQSISASSNYRPYRTTYRYYANVVSGTTFHEIDLGSGTAAPEASTANAQIYSTGGVGEELLPQAPPPAWDICVIGPRCWIVDAEVRSRVVFSKLRVAGVGFEFAPALELLLPSGAGKVMAVREWQGMPIVLTERAVYQIAGDGPSNTLGGGGAFSAPVKVSDIGCSNTASVVVCPAGILWQFHDRFVMLGPSGVSYVATFGCTHDVSAAVALTKYCEVLFFSATVAEVRVYHYDTGKWSTWGSATLADTVQHAHLMPFDQDAVLTYSETTGVIRRLEANSLSTANMVFETDWVLLGGDFQDHVILRDVIFNGRRVTAHDVQIEILLDYETSAQSGNSRSWTSATLAAMATDGYFSVRMEPRQQNCRAVKVRVTETLQEFVTKSGLSPRSLTIVYAVDGLLFEDAFKAGSRQ